MKTVDVQTVVYVSIEENMVGLVINAITGYVMIVEIAVVMKSPKRMMMINKLTLIHTQGCLE